MDKETIDVRNKEFMQKKRRVYLCARECMPLMAIGREILINEGISSHPNTFEVLEISMQRLGSLQDKRVMLKNQCIDFSKLYTLPASRFGVPDCFYVAGSRYSLTVDAPEMFFQKLALLVAQLNLFDFPEVKTIYANLAVRLLLRFLVADKNKFCPFRKCSQESVYRLYPLTFQLFQKEECD